MINQTDCFFFLSIYFQILFTVETGRELQTNRHQLKVPQGSGTVAIIRKYVYTCFPGLVYNECQVTLLILQIYSSMSVP